MAEKSTHGGDGPVATPLVEDTLGFRGVRAEPVTAVLEAFLGLPE